MLSARLETCPRVTFSGARAATTPARGPEAGMGGEPCPHKLGSTNHLRLLLYILIPTVSLLAGLLLLVLALTGIFGSSLLDSSPLPSPETIADSDPSYHDNSTNPSPFETDNVTSSPRNPSDDDITHRSNHSTPAATTSVPLASSSSSSQAPPTQAYTQPPDWLTSVTSLSTTWPISTTPAPDSGISYALKRNRK